MKRIVLAFLCIIFLAGNAMAWEKEEVLPGTFILGEGQYECHLDKKMTDHPWNFLVEEGGIEINNPHFYYTEDKSFDALEIPNVGWIKLKGGTLLPKKDVLEYNI